MAEPTALRCRENADIWTNKAAETALPQLRQSYLASAAAWNQQAERMEQTAALRAKRLNEAEQARLSQIKPA